MAEIDKISGAEIPKKCCDNCVRGTHDCPIIFDIAEDVDWDNRNEYCSRFKTKENEND